MPSIVLPVSRYAISSKRDEMGALRIRRPARVLTSPGTTAHQRCQVAQGPDLAQMLSSATRIGRKDAVGLDFPGAPASAAAKDFGPDVMIDEFPMKLDRLLFALRAFVEWLFGVRLDRPGASHLGGREFSFHINEFYRSSK